MPWDPLPVSAFQISGEAAAHTLRTPYTLQGDTALLHAAWDGHGEVVAALLAAGADVNVHNLAVCLL